MEITERRQRHRLPIAGPMPWLVFPTGKDMRDQAFCTISSLSSSSSLLIDCVLKSIPELRRRTIKASFHGRWLLLQDNKNPELMFLCDPNSSETIKLPPTTWGPKDCIRSIIITSSPKEPNCSVLLFHDDEPIIKYCRPGDQEWTEHDYHPALLSIRFEDYENPVFINIGSCNGVLYATISSRQMYIIRIDDHNHLNIESLGIFEPEPDQPMIRRRTYLMESFGELLCVCLALRGINFEEVGGIEVFKLDLSQMVWLKVESLKDRSIFLSSDCSTSCLATESGVEGNQIYFTIHGNGNLYVFNLEDESILVSPTAPKLQTPWCSPTWVMPPDLR